MSTQIIRLLFGTTTGLVIALLLMVFPSGRSPRADAFAPTSYFAVTVNTINDENGVGSGCSLREAITSANTHTNFGGCALGVNPGPGTNTIFLPSGIYVLSLSGAGEDANATGDLDIRANLIISSTGAEGIAVPSTVTGNTSWDDRIFDIVTGTVTMKGLVIQGGNVVNDTGGGVKIEPGQSLDLNDSTVQDNTASSLNYGGGIDNRGTLTLNHVTVFSNTAGIGGGIQNIGIATLTDVTFTGNSGQFGGGIDNAGNLTLTNATISGNFVTANGAGIFNAGPLTVTNATISSNQSGSAGGGIFLSLDNARLTNVTLSGNFAQNNGGGIYKRFGTVSLTNTIIANSTGSGNCNTNLGGSNNLSSDNSCGF